MELNTEADYQQSLRRLERLLDYKLANLSEIMALGNAVNIYENENGYQPLPPNSLVARLERQLSDQQLADLLGISQKNLRAVLNGQQPIDLDLVKRLHSRLGLPGDFILEAA
jgi:antitoxin component HigA of HigAB toxin-antitoxin module